MKTFLKLKSVLEKNMSSPVAITKFAFSDNIDFNRTADNKTKIYTIERGHWSVKYI